MEMNINFSAKGLDELIEAAQKKQDTKEVKMEKITEIVQGVARKYGYGVKWIEQEDLEQDLWVRVLDLINDCGGIENTDVDLVSKVCWNKAVDMYRYHRRRWDSKAEYLEASDDRFEMDDWNNMSSGQHDYFEALHCDKFMRGTDLVFFKEVIDQLEIGSKERKYVVMKLVNSGLIDKKFLDPWDQAIAEIPETEDEAGYIHALGYKSHCPGSWTCKKRALRVTIKEFIHS